MSQNSRQILEALFTEGLEKMHPGRRVKEYLAREEIRKHLTGSPVWLLATGKASLTMAEAAEEVLGPDIRHTLAIVPEGEQENDAVRTMPGNHPLPGPESLRAGEAALRFVSSVPEEGMLLALISGGTSAMLCSPAGDLTVEDLAFVNRLLLHGGATIKQTNTIRRHLSRIKGGRLLESARPGVQIVNLVLSDVPGDDPALVGSGPTVPQEMPDSREVYTHVIGSGRQLAECIAGIAEERGMQAKVADGYYAGDVKAAARRMYAEVSHGTADLHIWTGECTVTVTGSGRGGRNQELALHAARHIAGEPITWLSADTDGRDGPTDAAGAVVGGQTISRAEEKGMSIGDYADNNDSHTFHEEMGTLLRTGPTVTNLLDLQLILLDQ